MWEFVVASVQHLDAILVAGVTRTIKQLVLTGCKHSLSNFTIALSKFHEHGQVVPHLLLVPILQLIMTAGVAMVAESRQSKMYSLDKP